MATAITKQSRATAVVERNGRVLLIREKGDERFELPGGLIGYGGHTLEVALRELRRQTGLGADRAEYLFDYEGNIRLHKVVRIQAQGVVKLRKWEISEYKWWDRRESIPLLWAAKAIIDRCVKPAQAVNPDGTRR